MSTYTFNKNVQFLPWIGSKYADGKAWGGRLLVVGESHYGDDDSRNLTRDVIRRQWHGESYSYFTKIAQAFTGRPHEEIDKKEFWNSLAFYNYVQVSVGEGARIAPTDKMWEAAKNVLPSVIETLEPDYIVATGSRLWDRLPEWLPVSGHGICLGEKPWQVCQVSSPKGGARFATYILHPSSPAFGGKERWYELLKTFLNL